MEKNSNLFNVIIFSDSGGRDLVQRLNRINKDILFKVEVYPGAPMDQLIDRVGQFLRMKSRPVYDAIIIHGGVCSLTRITHMPYRAAVLQMDTATELLDKFKYDCRGIMEISTTAPIILAPLVGIDMVGYAGHWNERLYKMQPVLDEAVPLINNYIRSFNTDRGLPTPNTASCVHHCRGKDKGYRTHYQKLSDGCHPTDAVKEVWAKAFVECCLILFK